jgi:hypothetical protein
MLCVWPPTLNSFPSAFSVCAARRYFVQPHVFVGCHAHRLTVLTWVCPNPSCHAGWMPALCSSLLASLASALGGSCSSRSLCSRPWSRPAGLKVASAATSASEDPQLHRHRALKPCTQVSWSRSAMKGSADHISVWNHADSIQRQELALGIGWPPMLAHLSLPPHMSALKQVPPPTPVASWRASVLSKGDLTSF